MKYNGYLTLMCYHVHAIMYNFIVVQKEIYGYLWKIGGNFFRNGIYIWQVLGDPHD